MNNRQKLLFLIATMVVVAVLVGAVSIVSLYDAALTQQRARLVETVKSQARLMDAIARFETTGSREDLSQDQVAATLSQIIEAHSHYQGFGDTGEFALARTQGDRIVYLLNHRHTDLDKPNPVTLKGNLVQAMRRALLGESGILTGLDHHGERVMAAYEPIKLLNLGLVAKIDIAEVRKPFIRAALLAISVAFITVLFGIAIFLRITHYFVKQFEEQEATFRTLVETVHEAIILIDDQGVIKFVNPSTETLFGYCAKELIGQKVNLLMPPQYSKIHDNYLANFFQDDASRVINSGRELTAVRKNGSHFHVHVSAGVIYQKTRRLFVGVIIDISERKRLQEGVVKATLLEQRRIGQELHDGLGQQLTGLGLLAKSMAKRLENLSNSETESAQQLAVGIQQAIAQVRTLSRGLIPVQIDAQGLTSALQELVEEFQQQSDITIDLHIEKPVKISNNITAMHVYRIAQEAITNAVKHAQPQLISVKLKPEGEYGILEITDDGSGLPKDIDSRKGLGLQILRHRSSLFGGHLSIKSAGKGGTRIRCKFPLDGQGDALI